MSWFKAALKGTGKFLKKGTDKMGITNNRTPEEEEQYQAEKAEKERIKEEEKKAKVAAKARQKIAEEQKAAGLQVEENGTVNLVFKLSEQGIASSHVFVWEEGVCVDASLLDDAKGGNASIITSLHNHPSDLVIRLDEKGQVITTFPSNSNSSSSSAISSGAGLLGGNSFLKIVSTTKYLEEDSKFELSDAKTGKVRLGVTLPRSADRSVPNTWTPMDGPDFQVRMGPNYSKNKQKAPSTSSMYEVLGCDVFRCNRKVKNLARLALLRLSPEEIKAAKSVGLPPLIILNSQCPDYPPPNPVWGTAKDDGEGWSVVMYCKLKTATIEEARKPTDQQSAGLKLLQKFIALEDPSDPLFDRFKICTTIANLDELEFYGATRRLLSNFNGRPFLSRPQHVFHRCENLSYLGIDLDVHRFSYLARLGLEGVKEKIQSTIFDFGLVIEGQSDDELPERMIACASFNKLDLSSATSLREYLKSPTDQQNGR